MLLPNQINQPTQKPTLRWLFQLLEGIHVVIVRIEGTLKRVIEGLTDLKEKIIRCFGHHVKSIYGLV